MEIFINASNIHPHISLVLLNAVSFYNICNIFCRYTFKNDVTDRYMQCIMQNLKKSAQVNIYSLADLNLGHCVELAFLEGKLGRFLYLLS